MRGASFTLRFTREVLLVGIQGGNAVQLSVIAHCRDFGATIVARDPRALVVQLAGATEEIDRFLEQLPTGAATHICREVLQPTRNEEQPLAAAATGARG